MESSIKDYEQAVYVYWYGPQLPTVKIGHSNDPDSRLLQLGNDTGVPDHLASFAAIVWLDRKREKVEALTHKLAAEHRRSGEWFEMTAASALEFIIKAAQQLGVKYEVEDRAGIYIENPKTHKELEVLLSDAEEIVIETKNKFNVISRELSEYDEFKKSKKLESDELDDDNDFKSPNEVRLRTNLKALKNELTSAIAHRDRLKFDYFESLEKYKNSPQYHSDLAREKEIKRIAEERQKAEEARFNDWAVQQWKVKWEKKIDPNPSE